MATFFRQVNNALFVLCQLVLTWNFCCLVHKVLNLREHSWWGKDLVNKVSVPQWEIQKAELLNFERWILHRVAQKRCCRDGTCPGLVSLTTRPLWVDVQNVLVSIQTSLMVCVFKLFNGTTLGLWQVIMGTPVCEICYAKEAGEWCSKGPPFGTKSRESAIKKETKVNKLLTFRFGPPHHMQEAPSKVGQGGK